LPAPGLGEPAAPLARPRKDPSNTMRFKLSFLGAAGSVSGSRFLLEANKVKVLVDCGLCQERESKHRDWQPFPVSPDTIDAVLLTHAHIDHCGLLPKLVREGFRKDIYCTGATADIAEIMLVDSAKIQQEDAEFKSRRHGREGRKGPYPEIPLYTVEDAQACFPHFSPVEYGKTVQIGDGVAATFYNAGHVFGSSMIMVSISQGGVNRTVLFSGDVGRRNEPIQRDPTVFQQADYVLVESTYGDRVHEDSGSVAAQLAGVVNSAVETGGNIVVPSFALERTQDVLYHVNKLLIEDRIPPLMVFVDSPMAVSITEVFERHPEMFDSEMKTLVRRGNSPFDFPGLTMVREVEESKAINRIRGTAMIIAGSGMCTGGRVKHHLVSNISRPESTILFVGYQAQGTLGRQIVDGATEVRILGERYPVRAKVAQIQAFSAHADRDELLRWLFHLDAPPRQVFVVHGEPEVSSRFAESIRERAGWKTTVPAYRQDFVLN
jgi:metallo-beta-lactamase family protein